MDFLYDSCSSWEEWCRLEVPESGVDAHSFLEGAIGIIYLEGICVYIAD